jgi:hypothetical protein
MRPLAVALAALASLSFVSLTAEPAQAVGLCVDESGHNGDPDLYNNMGPQPTADCDGIACYGYGGNGYWQTCVPPTVYCTESVLPCRPPVAIEPCELNLCQVTSASSVALCAYGDLYNNQAGQPSSGCDGAVCAGFSNGEWDRCVLDCTADGCPRLWQDPCGRLMCQPPMDP